MSERLVIIKDEQGLAELAEYLKDKQVVSFDTETTGVEKDSEIIGFSVCADEDLNTAYYVVISYWDTATGTLLRTPLCSSKLLDFMQDSLLPKALIMHNAIFDCWMVHNNFGVDLMPSVFCDTMILAHLLDENRRVGLKELGLSIFGEDANKEQLAMKASVTANGGELTKDKYELFKADADLLALYGAKDALLTQRLYSYLFPQLEEQKLDDFFFTESMPLLKGPTYDLNTTGLRVDTDKLQALKSSLEVECMEAKAFIYREIEAHIKDKYPGTSKAKTFNIGATQQIAWLVFEKLGLEFNVLTDSGKELCRAFDMKLPYTLAAKRAFIQHCKTSKGMMYTPIDHKGHPKKPTAVRDPWQYMACGKESLKKAAVRYKWADTLLKYKSNLKLLSTYVEGIQSRMKYSVIRPSFLQHGTTSGRYSSKLPNFQNLPRDDKRIKACIVSRPGRVFVGADYAQLEPRVFASFSQDERLLKCFKDGLDFYSVIGAEVFNKTDCTLAKDDSPNSFAVKYKKLRDVAKVIALATPYGTCAPQMASELQVKAGLTKSMQECQEIIDDYFTNYPSVEKLMLNAHASAKSAGVVFNLFGRPRRIPDAMELPKKYGPKTPHSELPASARNLLNLAMNHPIQSTGASIMNRASIACWGVCKELSKSDSRWGEVKIILQLHDELILEGPKEIAEDMVLVLKHSMENTVLLPGVDLLAEPKIAYNLADLK